MKPKNMAFSYSLVVAILAVIAIIAYAVLSSPGSSSLKTVSTDEIRQNGWQEGWLGQEDKGLTPEFTRRFEQNVAEAQVRIDEDSEDAVAWNDLGFAKQQLGDLHGAFDAYMKSLEIIENQFPTWNNTGTLLEQAGALPEAEAAFLRMRELQPDQIRTLTLINFYDRNFKEYREVQEKLLLDLTKGNSPQKVYLNELGQYYERTHEYDKAIAAYERLISLYPDETIKTRDIIEQIKRTQSL